ncbi:MAG TPA: FAD-dependent oxidoreductase [bacterium]|jgi:zeta-carotene desaturase
MKTVVLGGGISGMTAAWRLRQSGAQVTLIEARPYLGGRLASHQSSNVPTSFDNGPHLFLSAYNRARQLFQELGIEEAFEYPYPGAIPFIRADGRRGWLREWPLPAPLNFAVGLLGFSILSWTARQRAFRAARDLVGQALDWQIDAGQWLDSHSEPEERKIFWEPVIRAAINASAADIPVQNLRAIFRQGFCRGATGGRLGYAKRPLGEIFGGQSQAAMDQAGIEIKLRATADGLICESKTVKGIKLKTGEVFAADAVIAALPPWALLEWLQDEPDGRQIISEYRLSEWKANPITTIYLWGEDRPLLEGYTCLPGRRAGWIFDFARLWGDWSAPMGIIVDDVVVGAQRAAPLPIMDEVITAFPQLRGVRWTAWKQVSEKRATPLRPRELWGKILPQDTAIRGLYLAGDWLDPEMTPTVEAGVRAGEGVASVIAGRICKA